MYISIAGQRVLRRTYEKYCPMASYMNWHPAKTVEEVAKTGFPDVWARYRAS